MIYDGSNSYIIEPFKKENNGEYLIYYKKDLITNKVKCSHDHKEHGNAVNLDNLSSFPQKTVTNLRTYRLAMTSAEEFSTQHGGSPYSATNVLNTIAAGINMINPIFERDLGVTFTNVTTSDIVYDNMSDPFTSRPFTNSTNQGTLLEENHSELVAELGANGFDVGHVLVWDNTGGLASPGVCDADVKGEGFSGSDASLTNIFVDYAAHEIGHQFNGDHNFASQECETSTAGFRFEPGEGSSLMAYAGVCDATARYQAMSDPFFHSKSIDAMLSYITSDATCHTTSGTGNTSEPVANASLDITVPKQTPFVLVGTGTDGNDPANQLTYLWEQIDNSATAVTGSPGCADSDAPLFRFKSPVSDNFRVFPEMSQVLSGNNNNVAWEKLPCVARSMNFNLIVRDNNANWGRIDSDPMVVIVANTGPFAVSSPNGGENWTDNTNTVTWTENGTSAHCNNVDILLSTDNGNTFTIVAANVANDGSHDITLSDINTTNARLLIQCSVGGNFKSASTFFDISDNVFSIDAAMLPVELVDFKAELWNQKEAAISWTTIFEVNNSHFEVQKSRDGKSFSNIGRIEGVGNSTDLQSYRLIDKTPFKGLNYYRLKQVDEDGVFEYSTVKILRVFDKDIPIHLYPNPAKEVIYINGLDQSDYPVLIYNQLGQVVRQERVVEHQIDVSTLTKGIYYFEFVTPMQRYMEKVVVQ